MRLMTYTPILMLLNGYWMLSNRQIFENIVNSVNLTTDQMSSSHALNSMGVMSHSSPMLLFSTAFLIIIIIRVLFYPWLEKSGFTISSDTIEVDENLPNFYSAIKLTDADWFVKESNYMRDTYQFTFANKIVVDRLDDTPVPKKPIQSIAWYNILANPAYVREFNYFTASMADRSDYVVDDDSDEENDCEQSDMVSILINLAYAKQEVARSFEFKPGYSKTFGAEILKAKALNDSTVNLK